MPRLDHLPSAQRQSILTRPVEVNDDTPWAPLRRPLSESRLALVTTAGLHLRRDAPFGRDDHTYRVIPSHAEEHELLQSSSSIGFDRGLRMRDINVVFPIDRLRELVTSGEVGGLAPNFYSFVGAQKTPRRIASETAPEVAQRLNQEGADMVLLTPT